MSDLLALASRAYRQSHLVAPADKNAFAYYETILAKDPDNKVARDALRDGFPFAVKAVEQTISTNDFGDAQREIGLLAKADPGNYTLTLLRASLVAGEKSLASQQHATRKLKVTKAASGTGANVMPRAKITVAKSNDDAPAQHAEANQATQEDARAAQFAAAAAAAAAAANAGVTRTTPDPAIPSTATQPVTRHP